MSEESLLLPELTPSEFDELCRKYHILPAKQKLIDRAKLASNIYSVNSEQHSLQSSSSTMLTSNHSSSTSTTYMTATRHAVAGDAAVRYEAVSPGSSFDISHIQSPQTVASKNSNFDLGDIYPRSPEQRYADHASATPSSASTTRTNNDKSSVKFERIPQESVGLDALRASESIPLWRSTIAVIICALLSYYLFGDYIPASYLVRNPALVAHWPSANPSKYTASEIVNCEYHVKNLQTCNENVKILAVEVAASKRAMETSREKEKNQIVQIEKLRKTVARLQKEKPAPMAIDKIVSMLPKVKFENFLGIMLSAHGAMKNHSHITVSYLGKIFEIKCWFSRFVHHHAKKRKWIADAGLRATLVAMWSVAISLATWTIPAFELVTSEVTTSSIVTEAFATTSSAMTNLF